MIREKYLFITDPHLLPFNRFKMLDAILSQKPRAVFVGGDISYGPTLISDLKFLGKRIGRPMYFVLGNHDYHFSSIDKVHTKVKEVCEEYRNLVWLTNAGVVPITNEVAVIGAEGWYDAQVGNKEFIKYTFDWFLTSDFKKLPTWDQRFSKFKEVAAANTKYIISNLEAAMEDYKTVYLITHFPPWREANRYNSWISESFWEPYNTNVGLGKALEEVMVKHKKRNLIVFCGHTHSSVQIHVSRNIECRVGRGAYHMLAEDEIIYI